MSNANVLYAVSSGFLVNHKPDPSKFCDLENCLINNSKYKVLNCGHSFHEDCLINMRKTCIYCTEFYSNKINEISNSFNESLKSDIDDDDYGSDNDDNENDTGNDDGDDDDDGDNSNKYFLDKDHYIQSINELRILANTSSYPPSSSSSSSSSPSFLPLSNINNLCEHISLIKAVINIIYIVIRIN